MKRVVYWDRRDGPAIESKITALKYQIAGCLLQIIVAMLLASAASADAPHESEIAVRVQVNGELVTVDVDCFVRATPEEAWAVMTDYDNATKFISKLEKSTVVSRVSETMVVSQKGTMGFGPFSVPLESVTEIQLTPFHKMQARMISGNMKKFDAVTTLIREPDGTRIVHRAESIPDVWIPPLIGRAVVEFETRARFRQLLDEILRRKVLPEAGK